MSRNLRIALFFLLVVGAILSGWRLKANFSATSDRTASRIDSELTTLPGAEEDSPAVKKAPPGDRTSLGLWGAALVLNIVAAGLIAGHEVSHYVASRAMKAVYNDEGVGIAQPDYEKAEEEWAKGNHLESIELMRECLAKNPREQHIAIRIAEIYEKDLGNPLAAALEYEEVLKKKLPAERWGWAAIHLCNIYSGKLSQPEKAIDLLRRIVAEYGQTAAGGKARTRLEQLAADGVIPPLEEEMPAADEAAPEPESSKPSLPPGFSPKKR